MEKCLHLDLFQQPACQGQRRSVHKQTFCPYDPSLMGFHQISTRYRYHHKYFLPVSNNFLVEAQQSSIALVLQLVPQYLLPFRSHILSIQYSHHDFHQGNCSGISLALEGEYALILA